MNQVIQKPIEEKLISQHFVMTKKKATEDFGLEELDNYKGRFVAFYCYNKGYQWSVFNNESDWKDVLEYGATETIEEHLDKDIIEYMYKHPENWKENNW